MSSLLYQSIWFDLAVFLFLVLLGHILLGHFEDYKPRWRRILKVCLGLGIFVGLFAAFGRFWAWAAFVTPVLMGTLIVHCWWLPRHGINGWTGEPREKYLELVGAATKPAPRYPA